MLYKVVFDTVNCHREIFIKTDDKSKIEPYLCDKYIIPADNPIVIIQTDESIFKPDLIL